VGPELASENERPRHVKWGGLINVPFMSFLSIFIFFRGRET
jgi:hypothetical protein